MRINIFEFAKEFNADYYDPNNGVIYRVQAYNRGKRFGLPMRGIEMVDLDGKHIGYVPEPKNKGES